MRQVKLVDGSSDALLATRLFGDTSSCCSSLLSRCYRNIKPSEYGQRGISSNCWHFNSYFTCQAGAFHYAAYSPGLLVHALGVLPNKDLG